MTDSNPTPSVDCFSFNSEQLAQKLLAASLNGVYVFDVAAGRHVFVNPQYTALTGYAQDDLDAMEENDFFALFHPDDMPSVRGHIAEIVNRETAGMEIEYRFKAKDGRWIWCLSRDSVFEHGPDGRPNRILGMFIDVSERKRIEEALRESEQRYHAFINTNVDLMFCKDEQFRYRIVNDATARYFGRTREEVLGKTDFELMDKSGAEACQRSDLQVMAQQGVVTAEEVVGGRTYETTKFPLTLNNGRIGVGAIIREITARKQAAEAIAESEQRYRTLINSGLAMIWTSGLNRQCDYFNQIWLKFTGRPLAKELGSGWVDGVHPDDVDRCLDVYVAAFDRREPFSMEYRLRNADGEYRWIQDVGTPRFDDQDRFLGYIGHCLDISERKNAEEEREKLQVKLHQAQKMESIGRLAGGVAHDFNNMLGVILGHAELALDQVRSDQPIAADLRSIRKAAEHSAELTRQLLAFARKQAIARKVLDLNATVAGMLNMLRRLIGENIRLEWRPGPELWPVKMDPSQIDQMLANLCVNARDAIAGVGRVIVETANVVIDQEYCADHPGAAPGDYVQLAVSDDGCGIDRETQARLFEPFFTTKEMGKGTGLGLSTIYGIVKQNQGFVFVYSEPEQGSVFSILLPRFRSEGETIDPVQAGAEANQGNETILLVEDDPAILSMTTVMLQRQGYPVLAASTPLEAMRLAGIHPAVQLLITDVIMPEMNGRELGQRLLALHPNLKLLYMSGYTANVIAHHGVLDADVHFLQKPFTVKALALKVREALGDAAQD